MSYLLSKSQRNLMVGALALFNSALLSAAEDFRIEFDWYDGMKHCFASESPEIFLFNVPEGTTTLKVKMKDKQSAYRHGGGEVAYDGGSSIPQGALDYWEGPCPPSPHTYEFIVEAVGGVKKAKAKFSQKYP